MQKQREHWGSQIGFILAALGSAVGLGTLWKFPYMTGANGGGFFVLIYLACIFLIGIPLFMAELSLGRKAQRGAVGVFVQLSDGSSFWKGIGWLGVASSFLIMTYYATIAGWGLNYALMSLNQVFSERSPEQIAGLFEKLKTSADINLFWHLAFTGLAVSVVYPGVRAGIEFWSRIMTSTLLVMLIGLFLYCTTLDGFGQALSFVLYPDASKFKPSGVLEALGLAFFTLSLGQGIMLTYGSYMRKEDDIPKTGLVVGFGILIVAILASLTIFPIVFTFGGKPEAGPGLVFETLPLLFAKLPGSLIISTTFFSLFVFTGLTSAIALVEVVAANFMDLLGWSRKKAVLLTGAACFVVGIPSALSWTGYIFPEWIHIYGKTFFETIDDLVTVWMIPVCGFFITLYAGWFIDSKVIKEELLAGTVWKFLWKPWIFLIRYLAPVGILFIFLQKAEIINIDHLFGV